MVARRNPRREVNCPGEGEGEASVGGILKYGRPDRRRTSEPLYLQLHGILRSYLLSEDSSAVSRLPGEWALAAMFGVSRNTVSAALGMLAEENLVCRIRHRGTMIAGKLDLYDPQNARKSVGAVFPRNGAIWEETIRAMRDSAEESGLVFRSYYYDWDDPEAESRIAARAEKLCAGLIFYPSRSGTDSSLFEKLLHSGYPFVLFDLEPLEILCPCAATDHFLGSMLLTRAVLGASGGRSPVLVTEPLGVRSLRRRRDGFLEELERRGVPDGNRRILELRHSCSPSDFFAKLRSLPEKADSAVFTTAFPFLSSPGTAEKLAKLGIEWGVFDAVPRGASFSAIQHAPELGRSAMMLLKDLLRSPGVPVRTVHIPPEIRKAFPPPRTEELPPQRKEKSRT